MAGLSGPNDNIRYYRWDNGRAKPVLPNYTSQNYINSDMSLDDAISTLDQALHDREHNTLGGLQGGAAGEYYHVTQNIHDSLIGYEGYEPSPDNPFATVNWVRSQIGGRAIKIAWGAATGDPALGNQDDLVDHEWYIYLDFVQPSISSGEIYVRPTENWNGFQEAGMVIGGGTRWSQPDTDWHGWAAYIEPQDSNNPTPNYQQIHMVKQDIGNLSVCAYFLSVGY